MAGTTSEATLDMGLVGKVARTELRRIPTEAGVGANYDQAARAVAEAYLASYLKDGAGTVARVDELVRADAPGGAFPGPLPDGQELTEEFAVGRTLAAAALEHARADLEAAREGFAERALAAAERVPFAENSKPFWEEIGNTGDYARLGGVDMLRSIRSGQTCTPKYVLDRAMEIDLPGGRTADEVITPDDCEGIAEGLMASFGDVELDYADDEDIYDKLRKAVDAHLEKEAERGVVCEDLELGGDGHEADKEKGAI